MSAVVDIETPHQVAGHAEPDRVWRRRMVMLALNTVTIAALFGAMAGLMGYNGWIAAEIVMLILYGITLPWLSLGFWNGLVGFIIERTVRDPATYVTPQLSRAGSDDPVTSRTAIIMAVRNETAEAALARFETVQADLARTSWGHRFDFHILSDSDCAITIAREEAFVAAWRSRAPGAAVHYRRREENTGFKAGNIGEFVTRCGDQYEFFLPLDADSVMGARAVLRLVRVMQAAPEIGMLQGLVVGTPARSVFTRAFQFGMRHGMRAFTLGSAWWQGDCGPNWGHNVLIRTAPFREQCLLPVLPGRGPLAGHIMSHDQVEAVLMRRAGYEVRVLAEEDESYEDNPPSLPDFIKRELRWCQGNLQYLRLMAMPGLRPVSRLQLALAILMYVSAPAWIGFIALGAVLAAVGAEVFNVPPIYGLTLFAVIMTFNLMPKLMGLAQVLSTRSHAARYGGRVRLVAGSILEFLFSFLVAPAVAFALAVCIAGLMLGRRIGWEAQMRSRERLAWSEAARSLWPQTLAGIALAGLLAATAPWALIFGAPIILSLAGAIPFAVLTTLPAFGRASRALGLFDIPEDREAPRTALPTLRKAA